jgi:hypothetical protein
MRAAVDHMVRQGQLLQWGIASTGFLVETLLDRGRVDDLREAEAAIERLAAAPAAAGLAMRDIWVLRSRALLARARRRGELPGFRDTLPLHGDIAWLRGPHRLGRSNVMTLASANMAKPGPRMPGQRYCRGHAFGGLA